MRFIELPENNAQGAQYYSEFTGLESGNFIFARSAENWRGELLEFDFVKDSIRIISNFPVGDYHYSHFSNMRFSETNLTGIPANPRSMILRIYPQPASEHVFIEIPQSYPNCRLTLFDQRGSKLFSRDIHEKTTRLNLVDLKRGVYLIMLSDKENNKLLSAKIIRQ